MNNFINDPLGAMSKGLTTANQTIKSNVQKAADGIKNNENLKQSLANAKHKGMNGLSNASAMAGSMKDKLQQNASNVYNQNYHGQLYDGVSHAVGNLANKAQQKYH